MRSPSGHGAPWRPHFQRSERYAQVNSTGYGAPSSPPEGGSPIFYRRKKFFTLETAPREKLDTHKINTKQRKKIADVNMVAYRYLPEFFSICNTFHIDVTLKSYRYVILFILIFFFRK